MGDDRSSEENAVRNLLAAAEPLAAYDRAQEALASGLHDPALGYLAVLSLARAGATHGAQRGYAELVEDLDDPPPALTEDLPALGARLAKDRALAARGVEREERASVAADRYAVVFDLTGGHFPAVNVATMALIAGDTERSREWAIRALAAAEVAPVPDSAAHFWRLASLAEAHLLLGKHDQAAAALADASTSPGEAPARRAAAHRQLRLVCQKTGTDDRLLRAIANPPVVHYCGHRLGENDEAERTIRHELDLVLSDVEPGAAWGSLAAGADLLCAEALLAAGTSLHVVLPCAVADFLAASVSPAGARWVERFQGCLESAASVTFATEGPLLGHDALFGYTSAQAMGEALLLADRLDARAVQIAVWDGGTEAGPVGTGADVRAWKETGNPTRIVAPGDNQFTAGSPAGPAGPDRVVRAMLFGDVKGFSRLGESDLPLFFETVLGACAAVLDESNGVVYRNGWGDALYAVFTTAGAAARAAIALQSAVNGLEREALGLPDDLRLRLGGHAGPVFSGHDPIRDEPTFFGAAVTRTARIEPRTPEGEVYVTDAFAALVRLEQPDDFTCEYVGHVPTAKGYGTLPMYRLAPGG